jgi:hypothetical protein
LLNLLAGENVWKAASSKWQRESIKRKEIMKFFYQCYTRSGGAQKGNGGLT